MSGLKFSRRGKGGQPPLFPRIFLLALLFAVGVFMGRIFARDLPDSVGQELSDYLQQYLLLEADRSAQTVVSTAVLYLRYPILAVLLGFASIGIVLIPCLAAAFGFFASFSVSCFLSVFGADGVWLSFAAFGLRFVVTLPCFLVLAGPALGNAASLAMLSFGRGRHTAPVVYGRVWWLRLWVCLAILLLGVCVDLMIVPGYLLRVLDQILI